MPCFEPHPAVRCPSYRALVLHTTEGVLLPEEGVVSVVAALAYHVDLADTLNGRQFRLISLSDVPQVSGEIPFFNRLDPQQHLETLVISGASGQWLRDQNFLLWLDCSPCSRLELDVDELGPQFLGEILQRVPFLETLVLQSWPSHQELPTEEVSLRCLSSLSIETCPSTISRWCRSVGAPLVTLETESYEGSGWSLLRDVPSLSVAITSFPV